MKPFLPKHILLIAALAVFLISARPPVEAATYRVGDVLTNFTFVARRAFTNADGSIVNAGDTVHLHDFAGKVVFLEWFAVWCPFCVQAAPQVESGIVDHYAARGGNPHGVQIMHVAVNQEPARSHQSNTDRFINQHGFPVVVNDYDSTSTNRVRFLFQNSGQPIFAVINGVTNSPTHRPWELLVNHLGYGQTDFSQTLAGFRAVIDQVQPAPPVARLGGIRISDARTVELEIHAPPGRSYRVEASADATTWSTIAALEGSSEPVIIRDTNASAAKRFYRTVTP